MYYQNGVLFASLTIAGLLCEQIVNTIRLINPDFLLPKSTPTQPAAITTPIFFSPTSEPTSTSTPTQVCHDFSVGTPVYINDERLIPKNSFTACREN